MNNDDEILESLIAGGLIGAGLGALVSKNKNEGATLGAVAGAVILATYKANQKARESNVPMYIAEEGNVYEIQADGTKKYIRKIEKPAIKLEDTFKLK